MDFDLDQATLELRDAVADFARASLGAAPGASNRAVFRQRWQLLARQGLTGSAAPVEYGGGGVDAVTAAALMEGLGYGSPDMGLAFSVAAHVFACLVPISLFGTPEQKRRWLPGLCAGELIAAHAVTEPDAGSDALGLRTRAVPTAAGYALTGEKCFITNAPVADVFLVQAVTAPGRGYFALSSFLVRADNPGLQVGPPLGKLGLRSSPTADLRLDDCVVSADDMLGTEGSGASVFSASMAWERTCLFACYLGAMRRVIEGTTAHATQRHQFGAPVGSFQAVSHRIVDMLLRAESARLLLYRAASGLARGDTDEIPSALAKLAVSEAAVQVGLDAVQLRGAFGILDGEAETFLRDALPARIFSGTSEIQRNNIARALGLGPRRPPAAGAAG